MKRSLILTVTVLALFALARAQEPAPEKPALEKPAVDTIGQEASKLEAELGKYKDTSPEAAETLVKLVELYHADGRVFGLIRAAETFTVSHPADPRHQAVMLKLIDGLQATSRNPEMAATCRQFLGRYPKAAECGAVELRLADTLLRMADRTAAADACRLVWTRQSNTPVGRRYGALAVANYSAVGSTPSITAAAELAEEMLDKSPSGEFAKWIGYRAVNEWRRISQWAPSCIAGNKLAKKGLTADKPLALTVYGLMVESYGRLGQHANAAEVIRRARSINDTPELHRQQIERLNSAQADVRQIEPLVNDYVRKYSDRQDRFAMQAVLAFAYMRLEDKRHGLEMLGDVLKNEAVWGGTTDQYVRNMGGEPADITEAEKVLRDAINANPKQAACLRYYLAFRVYRDKMHDDGKVRATLRDLITRSPSDNYSREAVEWLLDNAPSIGEFGADVDRIIKSRRANLHFPNFHKYLGEWQVKAKAREDFGDKARQVADKLRKADADPILSTWVKNYDSNTRAGAAERDVLLKPDVFGKLTNDMAHVVAWTQAEYFRQVGTSEERAAAIPMFVPICQRFRDDYPLAQRYLQMATDYGTPEECKAAAQHMLRQQPQAGDMDSLRRLIVAGEKSEDAGLVKQAYARMMKCRQLFGPDPGAASTIGEMLERLEMKTEATEYWTTYAKHDPNNGESKNCAQRLWERMEPKERITLTGELARTSSNYQGTYAQWQADEYFKLGDLGNFERVLRDSRKRQDQRPLLGWSFSSDAAYGWVSTYRADVEQTDANRLRVYRVLRDIAPEEGSALAQLAILEIDPTEAKTPMERILAYQAATRKVRNDGNGWNRLMPFAQAALAREDYQSAATLLTGMLANITGVDDNTKKTARDMVAQAYGKMGAVGLTIDETSPIAPLLKAALSLRLGDQRLAFDTYMANRQLFDQHRTETPVDLVVFVCEKLTAAGGDENHDRVEATLRGWLVQHSESKQFDAAVKARMQLLLARNYFKAQRYDVARNEFTTVINRYGDTPEAVEAEFGIGETFMAQKVFDQAEVVFEKLAGRRELDIVVRAEFLRGVLALRRGDNDDARDIFRAVLDRVPDVELANQALFSLSEVYGAEQRYLDQLRLLRTVGRLGHKSKRYHTPGMPLSIVVHDSDLGISRGHHRIPVIVTTTPGGDREMLYLISAGAGKGLFRADLETQLGSVTAGDKVLQLTGNDVIRSDYPDEFKAEFRSVPLSDVEIRIASDATFETASSKIVEQEEESFSQRLEREADEQEEIDQRVSQGRPANQIKPGNPIYLRVRDADRDLSDAADPAVVKLVADSGDQVQAVLTETGPHTGIFEGTVATGELPAGALATDAAIDHGPLMAIDRDPKTFWQSVPDGATPKSLTIDLKDLRSIASATVSTPDAESNRPVRAELRGSHDGQFWFHLAGHPAMPAAEPVAGECGQMTRRVFNGRNATVADWNALVELTKNTKPIEEEATDELRWTRPEAEDDKEKRKSYLVLWRGTLVQHRASAARFAVSGVTTALAIDGRLEMPVGPGNRTADVWLDAGPHELTILATATGARDEVEAVWARADLTSAQVKIRPFEAADFDLSKVDGEIQTAEAPVVTLTDEAWQCTFPKAEVRFVRFEVQEYLGEAVAINHVEIRGENPEDVYVPTEADVLALSNNDVLEIAGGDVVTATYTDEFTVGNSSHSRLLETRLTATYFNATVSPIAYDFTRSANGAVSTERKRLLRIDPGERLIVEVTDYDEDRTSGRDEIGIKVAVNGGDPIELTATETEEFSGVFTKEVDTAAEAAEGKLAVKPGDRVACWYTDRQNTFPGHAVPRETIVLVNEPTEARIRVIQSRATPPPPGSDAAPRIEFLAPEADQEISGLAMGAPITVEVIDPDAAKDSRSSIVVSLATSDGAKADVHCVVSDAHHPDRRQRFSDNGDADALHQGRFVGQVILQLGGAGSPEIVPRTSDMPRSVIGGPVVDEESATAADRGLVARVLNVTGKDIVTATYNDTVRPSGEAAAIDARGRLITAGTLVCTDRRYEEPMIQLHVGEKMFLRVMDADRDATDERDVVTVEVTTERGEKEEVPLEETLAHSGVFTGSLLLKAVEQPTPGNLQADEPVIESFFGDTVSARYVDPTAPTETGELEVAGQLPVVIGTDGLVAAFTKTFNNEDLAVETKFHVAESYFELFKSHKQLGREEETKADLEAGRRILREVMEDYTDPKYAPRVTYLLGQFAQELEQWDEAIASYALIIQRYSDHSLAADAQYKMGQCYEKAGDFDRALEAYVTLAATYPNSPLIASAMIRISDFFYKKERFEVATQVGEKFLEKFTGHEHATRMAFRVGQCYFKMEDFAKAAESFDGFVKTFPESHLAADAMFWSGESYRQGRKFADAFSRYNRCRWDHPESEAAKYARGRLAMPEMLDQFEKLHEEAGLNE